MPTAKKTARKSAHRTTGRASSRSGAKKSPKKSAKKPAKKSSGRRWVRNVTTDSTHPPEGLFRKSAPEIARALASKRVSPKGPASGMRMLVYFLNRGGKGLSATRRKELERARRLLHERIEREKQAA